MKLLIAMGKALLTMFIVTCVLGVSVVAYYSLVKMDTLTFLVSVGVGVFVVLFCLLTDSFYEAQKNKP